MSAEWVTAIATAGTFVVIAASAIAALVQLRHMRGSNQIVALTELREVLESESFQAYLRDIYGPFQERLKDEAVLQRISTEHRIVGIPEFEGPIAVANFFENAGCLVKNGIVDANIFCDLWGQLVTSSWDALEPMILARRVRAGRALYENFEYLTVLGEEFSKRYPEGTYPRNMPRKPNVKR